MRAGEHIEEDVKNRRREEFFPYEIDAEKSLQARRNVLHEGQVSIK